MTTGSRSQVLVFSWGSYSMPSNRVDLDLGNGRCGCETMPSRGSGWRCAAGSIPGLWSKPTGTLHVMYMCYNEKPPKTGPALPIPSKTGRALESTGIILVFTRDGLESTGYLRLAESPCAEKENVPGGRGKGLCEGWGLKGPTHHSSHPCMNP